MTLPPPPKTSNIWKTLAIALLVVVIILGAIVGLLWTNLLPTNQGVGTNNQVRVSGSIFEADTGKIVFATLDEEVTSSTPFAGGHYSILLLGNQSYDVSIQDWKGGYWRYTIFVPTGTATFNANF